MTTYTAFLNSLATLPVVGITKYYADGQPATLQTTHLPAQWVDLPSGTSAPATCAGDMTRTLAADLIIALEPVGQNLRPANFSACVAMLDNLHCALDGWNDPLDGVPSWVSRLAFVTVGGVVYWAIVTEVSGLG